MGNMCHNDKERPLPSDNKVSLSLLSVKTMTSMKSECKLIESKDKHFINKFSFIQNFNVVKNKRK